METTTRSQDCDELQKSLEKILNTKRKRAQCIKARAYPDLDAVQVENKKRLHKNNREKERRSEINEAIDDIAKLLNVPSGRGIEKVKILQLAGKTLSQLLAQQE